MILTDLAHNLHLKIPFIFSPAIQIYMYFNLIDGKKDDSRRLI